MVRGKFKLVERKQFANWAAVELTFRSEYDPTLPEDIRFSRATPIAEIKMTVDNPAAVSQFSLGQHYYADLSPVEPTNDQWATARMAGVMPTTA